MGACAPWRPRDKRLGRRALTDEQLFRPPSRRDGEGVGDGGLGDAPAPPRSTRAVGGVRAAMTCPISHDPKGPEQHTPPELTLRTWVGLAPRKEAR